MVLGRIARALGIGGRSGIESRRLGGHQPLKVLHDGEKARVYQAQAPDGQETVVVKVYKPGYNRTARRIRKRYGLRNEGEMGMLVNPGGADNAKAWPIVRTLGFGHEFGDPAKCLYVVQEFIEGLNAKHLLGCDDAQFKRMRMTAARVVGQGLSIIHDCGHVHRDVCMDNVLISRDGGVKLIDLGFMAPQGVAFQEKSGTPSYMAPEQFRAEPLRAACDIYAFGVLLFELFTGRLPFVSRFQSGKAEVAMRRNSDLMTMHLKERPPKPSKLDPHLPKGLEPIIMRCLEKDPADRYPSIKSALIALAKVDARRGA